MKEKDTETIIKLSDNSDSALHWTVEDMLTEALDGEMDSPSIKAVLTIYRRTPDGERSTDVQILHAGCEAAEAIGLLQIASQCMASRFKPV